MRVGRLLFIWACLAALAPLSGGARAVEVWMPETGEVELEQLPRDETTDRFRHAMALVGAGQWAGGRKELRKLLEEAPQAEWAPQARLVLGRGLIRAGKFREAFEELQMLREAHPETPLAERARRLQRQAARLQAGESIGKGRRLYEQLIAGAETTDEAALLQKEKADAIFEARRYLEAEDEYLVLASHYSRSPWAPYAWYKIADCEWELAKWLDLGLERLKEAQRAFEDFTAAYPDHARAAEAREKKQHVRRRQAGKYREIAEFYVRAEDRPWAAVHYLRYIVEEFPDTPEAEWAAGELERIEQSAEGPLRGEHPPLELPGVTREGGSS